MWDWQSGSQPLPPPPLLTQGWVQPWRGARTLFCILPVPQLRAAAVSFDPHDRRSRCGWLCWWHRWDTLPGQPTIHPLLKARARTSSIFQILDVLMVVFILCPDSKFFSQLLSLYCLFYTFCGLFSSETRGQIDSLVKFRSKCLNFVTFFVLWIGKELFS